MTIPLLVRQIEGLKLLQKTRKPKQDDDKRVNIFFFFLSWQDLALSPRLVLSSQLFSFLSLKSAKIIDTCHHTQHILLLHFLSLSVI